MRVLLLLRGSPGCGKTTWIEKNGLSKYTLSADSIRLMCSSPGIDIDGKEYVNPDRDTIVWATLFKILETRMQNGDFTVIDATNSKTSEMSRYKQLCDSYKYRIYIVDFTDIPPEVAKERNLQREPMKQVPNVAIDKMYSRFATQKIPAGITVIKPDELEKIWYKKINLDNYNKIHVIGDVHGCYTALSQYIPNETHIKDDEFYIFVGDLLDRGIENADVMKFILSIYNKPNVYIIEGNHERHLYIWANGGVASSKEFELSTKLQLESAKIDKKEVRKLYRRIGQCAFFEYRGNEYLVTHGGLSCIPDNMTFISLSQIIKGVGEYKKSDDVDAAFIRNTPANCFQIHGHRNVKESPLKVNDRCYNLEGKVEFGGYLRCVELLNDGTRSEVEIKNDVYKELEVLTPEVLSEQSSVGDLILSLRKSKFIQEKSFGNISSFSFTKQAFYDQIWDEQTTKARGLYINIPKAKIVARAYNKFFNINERPETKFDMLAHTLSFPVTAYVKENGFLGIVSYNDEDDSLIITSKSCLDGDYSAWLKEVFYDKVTPENVEKIKSFSKENNVSFVFECIDMKHDPHIIEYENNRLVLLDVIYNDINYHKIPYTELQKIASEFGLECKEIGYVLVSWQDFFDWYYTVLDDDYRYMGNHIEGFVIEDSIGKMVKLKLTYYNRWKHLRSIAREAIRKGYIDPRRTSSLLTPLANQFYAWVKTLHGTADYDSIPKDICTLRNLFFKTEEGKKFIDY